ncbi:aldo/keto reductase [Microbulbifer hydrolyticus]|uniref:Aldo/keto reductase n=1 Tax=Microbulbifer hydrolyticus TaxID=48074 RepID=A0A6P1TDW2_9GAMM|nr:aldo/keto reductase [Microbulbifer hydrolyticus]MBB5212592.1 aryl-alcohol dehydrogenase-like predicted oxidoreductase [Microbulbifer hydrolyticus]QHQ40207.1 aldo/keto reductase [Microbulbifer hydrolyticus]
MHMRQLGKTGYQVSEIGLGCWQLGGDFGPLAEGTANAILDAASQQGVNFWDTADVYGGGLSEQRIGDFQNRPKDLLVATKVGRGEGLYPDGYRFAAVRDSLQASAKRLGVETIDLAQLHCVPHEVLKHGEIFSWLDDLKQEGLIRHYGASVETLDEAFTCLQAPGLATLQVIFNVFRQDAAADLLGAAQEREVGIIVRLPLASGLLSGKFHRHTVFAESDHRNYNRDGAAFSVGETFGGIPFEKGVTLAQGLQKILPENGDMAALCLRWILDHPAVSTIIAGASSPQQIRSNVSASRISPLPESLHRELARYYHRQVRPHIRGSI